MESLLILPPFECSLGTTYVYCFSTFYDLLTSFTILLLVTALWTTTVVSNCFDVIFRLAGTFQSSGGDYMKSLGWWLDLFFGLSYSIYCICLYICDNILVLYVSNSRNLSSLKLFCETNHLICKW